MKRTQCRSGPERIRAPEVLFGVIFLMWLLVPVRVQDDNWFLATYVLNFQHRLLPFLSYRYGSWSTRLLLEAYTLFLLEHPFVYRMSMGLWVIALSDALRRLLGQQGNRRFFWAMTAAVLWLPVDINLRAGAVCSTVNYVFALACVLWGMVPVVTVIRSGKAPLWQMILSVPLMVLGCNMEYYAPAAFLACVLLAVLQVQRKQLPWLSVLLALIAAGSLWYAMASPAGTVASYNSSDGYFPGFESLSVLQKLRAAFVSTAGGLISTYAHGDDFFLGTLAFGVLLGLWGLEKEKTWVRWLYLLPGAMTLTVGLTARIVPSGSAFATVFFDSQGGWLWNRLPALLATLVFFGCMGVCLWRVDRRVLAGWIIVLLCRVLMGISSSLFYSGLRTFYPVLYLLAAASAVLLSGLEKYRKAAWITTLAISGMMLSVNIYSLLM